MTKNRQHDDHIWLTVNGEGWAIYQMKWPHIWLWRGYYPNLQFTMVNMTEFDAKKYCDMAVKLLYG
jgi:hypothetical protein